MKIKMIIASMLVVFFSYQGINQNLFLSENTALTAVLSWREPMSENTTSALSEHAKRDFSHLRTSAYKDERNPFGEHNDVPGGSTINGTLFSPAMNADVKDEFSPVDSSSTTNRMKLSDPVTSISTETLTNLKVNFQDSATVTPVGWLRDYGQAFGPRSSVSQGTGNTYGWKKREDNTPLDLTRNGRKRTSPSDTLLATLMHMQANALPTNFNGTRIEGIWEAQVANGTYEVTVSVGDGTQVDSRHFINIEGQHAIIDFVPNTSIGFKSVTIPVSVTDGLLTIDAIGGTNTKINYVIIQPTTKAPVETLVVSPVADAFTRDSTFASDNCGTNTKINYVIIQPTTKAPVETLVVSPVADAFTRDSTFASDNYGSDTSLLVKTHTTRIGFTRFTYLKFPINVNNVFSAKLRVYGRNTESTATIPMSLYGIEDDSWTESGITWNNAPASSPTAISFFGVNDQARYLEIDVSDFVKAQSTGDKMASFLLRGDTVAYLNLIASFNSKEYGQSPPQLVIVKSTASGPTAKALTFAADTLNYTVEKEGATASQAAILSSNDETPTISLTKSANSDWLILPSTPALGSLSFGVTAAGLLPGNYSATVTATAGGYVSGTLQVNLHVSESGANWLLGGNTGTKEGTHFMGTTDSSGLVFKTNNLERIRISGNGNIGIGTATPDVNYLLSVSGKIKAKGLRVQTTGWADYVFEPSYPLRSLSELEKFIRVKKHLPEMPTTAEVEKKGVDVSEIQVKLLQKIEELTLYIIEQNKRLEEQAKRLSVLEGRVENQKKSKQ